MKKIVSITIIIQIVVSQPLFSYDLSHEVAKRGGPITVALVPYAEGLTPSLEKVMGRLESEIRRTKGIRVLDQGKTEAILQYYSRYVNQAQESTDTDVEGTLTTGRQSLLSKDYDQAARLLDLTEKKIMQRVQRGGSNEGLYQIYLLRAKIHKVNGDEGGVQREYDRLVLLAPDFQLDPNLYSNWERTALKTAREKIAPQRTGSIEIASKPEGSEVFLNGIHVGITPLTLKYLPPFQHIVEIKTVNHAPFIQKADLRKGQTLAVNASLVRNGAGAASPRTSNTIRPSLYKSELEISRLISTLGYHLGVDKVILVADKKESGIDTLVYRLGDTQLGAVQKQNQTPISSAEPKEGATLLVSSLKSEIQTDVLKDPSKFADPSVGSIALHEKRRPIYKRPLFWVLVAAGAGAGGALGAVFGGAGAAATGGIIIGL